MISFWDTIFASSMLITSIIIFWISSLKMIDKKRILVFLPFFLSAIVLVFSSVLSFYSIFNQKIWFFMEIPWFIIVFWIIINLGRENGRIRN